MVQLFPNINHQTIKGYFDVSTYHKQPNYLFVLLHIGGTILE